MTATERGMSDGETLARVLGGMFAGATFGGSLAEGLGMEGWGFASLMFSAQILGWLIGRAAANECRCDLGCDPQPQTED